MNDAGDGMDRHEGPQRELERPYFKWMMRWLNPAARQSLRQQLKEMEVIKAEQRRRDDLRNQAELDKRAYLRYEAFAICNRCKRPLTRDVVEKQGVCPYCGGDSATLIEHQEEEKK